MVKAKLNRLSTIIPPKNLTRVKSSIELAQFMKSPGSIHEFSYIVRLPAFCAVFLPCTDVLFAPQTLADVLKGDGEPVK